MKLRIKDRIIKRILIIAIVSWSVTALMICGIAYYCFDLFGGEREVIVIPQYVGQRFDTVESFDRIKVECEPVFSNDVPEGEIISQFPYGGARRKIQAGEKYTVKLSVSIGKESESIPDLKDYKYTDAAAALRSIGAEIRIVSVYDDRIEADAVIRTSPAAGEKIGRGETVTLFVGRNHVKGSVCVKDFVGMSKEVAIAEILSQGLTLGEITEERSVNFERDTVISQSISPECYVLYGTKIDITVNFGEADDEQHPFRKDIFREDGEINESVD